MADSSSSSSSATLSSPISFSATFSNSLPVAAFPTLPAFTAAGSTSTPTGAIYQGSQPFLPIISPLQELPTPSTIFIGSLPVSTAPFPPVFSAAETTVPLVSPMLSSTGTVTNTNPSPTLPTLSLPPTAVNIPPPQMTVPAGIPAIERQPNNFGVMPPPSSVEQSNAALTQAITMMAENMTRMQTLLTTLVQNQSFGATPMAPVPPPYPGAFIQPPTQRPLAGLAHIPPDFLPQYTYGAVSGSAPPLHVQPSLAPSFRPVFISAMNPSGASGNTPPVSVTLANPTPVLTPNPQPTDAPSQSPRARNVAFVNELLQENYQDNLETRLEARIASLQEAERRRLAKIEERLNAVQGNNFYAMEDADLHIPQFRVPHKYRTPDPHKYRTQI